MAGLIQSDRGMLTSRCAVYPSTWLPCGIHLRGSLPHLMCMCARRGGIAAALLANRAIGAPMFRLTQKIHEFRMRERNFNIVQ
jgi:hypothetical protein